MFKRIRNYLFKRKAIPLVDCSTLTLRIPKHIKNRSYFRDSVFMLDHMCGYYDPYTKYAGIYGFNIRMLTRVITHEFIHKILDETINNDTCKRYDVYVSGKDWNKSLTDSGF